jgi:hypothetical protein
MGTDCDPSYPIKIYNDGQTITRGAARIVYTRYDKNKNNIIDPNEKYVFYTYNHYNDFQEYLNYEGGWGEIFGNVTGGGNLSSKTDYNPTPYVPSVMGSLKKTASAARSDAIPMTVLYFDPRTLALLLSPAGRGSVTDNTDTHKSFLRRHVLPRKTHWNR